MDESPKKSRKPTVLITGLGFAGVVAAVILGRTILDGTTDVPKPRPPKIELPRPPEEVAKPHLSKAEQECERVIDEHVKALDGFFIDSKKNTRGFAEDSLGWGSKRRLIQDFLP